MSAWDELVNDAAIVLTLLVLEAVLSFDNAAVLAAMVRKLPIRDRRKALLYGLAGAYALRIAAILLASFLIENPILKVLGGAYLIFIGAKHFIALARHKAGTAHHSIPGGRFLQSLGLPALVAIIIQIEVMDLAFAIDQVVVAVAFTEKILLIIIASMIGILFLRLAAAVVARIMDWLPTLEHLAFVAVIYVGVKLILLYPFFATGYAMGEIHGPTQEIIGGECRVPFIPVEHEVAVGGLPGCEIPIPFSIGVTLLLFGTPILLKLLFKIPRSKPGSHPVASGTTPPQPPPSPVMLEAAHTEVKSGRREIDGVMQPPRPPPP